MAKPLLGDTKLASIPGVSAKWVQVKKKWTPKSTEMGLQKIRVLGLQTPGSK